MSDQKRFVVDVDPNKGLDCSSEAYREYTFPGGQVVRVGFPKLLWVKVSTDPAMAGKHSHRIETVARTGVYIPAGWIKLEWKRKDPALNPVQF